MEELEIHDMLLAHLLENGWIEDAQATEVIEEHGRTGRSIRHTITDLGVLDEDSIIEQIAFLNGCDVLNLASHPIDPEVVREIPASVARMHNVMPVSSDQGTLVLATSDVVPPEMYDELVFVLNRDVTFRVSREKDIEEHIIKFYGDESESVTDMLSALESELEDSGELPTDLQVGDSEEDIARAANQAPVVRFVNLVMYEAVNARASDIHFEPFEHDFKIRYRVDGSLYEMAPPPKHLALPVISRIKVMSGLDISERRLPQDGRIEMKVNGHPVDFRVSSLPTQFGESVVLRVLDRSAIGLELENLGMPDDVYEYFTHDITMPNGIVVVTGPTGSGKTTTLYSGLRRINKVETKLLTAEDPVEYDLEGIVQVPVNEKVGVTFAKVLRAFLRQDPDIIMVGEIRDLETAQIAIQASLTGHLVFSTLHTNDAAGAVTRFVDMGVEPFLIASTLQAVMGTRLIRTICSDCRTAYAPDDDLLERLNLTREEVGDSSFYHGSGCTQCNNTGYRGRRGIYEYLRVTDPIRALINDRRPTIVVRERARELGMRTLREDGIRCVLDGYTTVDEVLKYT